MRTRFFWGAGGDEHRVERVKLDRFIASKDDGGLWIGSLFSFNIAMIFRWWRRFYKSPNLLWVRVIKVIYGWEGGCRNLISPTSVQGSWVSIIRMFTQLRHKDIDLQSFCPIRVGNGTITSFWHDVWTGDVPLSSIFPRDYLLDLHRYVSIGMMCGRVKQRYDTIRFY